MALALITGGSRGIGAATAVTTSSICSPGSVSAVRRPLRCRRPYEMPVEVSSAADGVTVATGGDVITIPTRG
jgi:hypothetical protein